MKKILLISYYFPPVNSVAGLRAWSWAKNFKDGNIDVTVVTRHWSGNETKWSDLTVNGDEEVVYETLDKYDVYRLPSKKIKGISLLEKNLLRISFFSKLFYISINALGIFNAEADGYSSFRRFLKTHLKKNHYDRVIVTSPPLNLIRLAAWISKTFSISVHVDFRDLWNNGYLHPGYQPPFNLKWIDRFKRFYIKKWLLHADGVSAVSEPIAEKLKYIYDGEVKVITNGFDDEVFERMNKVASSQFRFSMVGTYYPQQSFEILIKGLNNFLQDKTPAEFVVNLVGVTAHDEVINLLRNSLPAPFLNIVDRVNADEAVEYVVNSEVLFQAAWKGYKGIYTTKLFDFIASGNYVLVAPGDDNVIDEVIQNTESGFIAHSEEEFTTILQRLFDQWKSTGVLVNNKRDDEVAMFSRRKIALDFAAFINSKK